MKKKQKQNISITLVGIAIIGLAMFYSYTADQAKIRGFTFGNDLQSIQDEIKQIQETFESNQVMLEEGDITKEEFLEYSEKHIQDFEELILKYDELLTPESFRAAVKAFKLSSESQLTSDKEFIIWVETEDNSAKIRSHELLQEAFEYETFALGLFNSAKGENNP